MTITATKEERQEARELYPEYYTACLLSKVSEHLEALEALRAQLQAALNK